MVVGLPLSVPVICTLKSRKPAEAAEDFVLLLRQSAWALDPMLPGLRREDHQAPSVTGGLGSTG